ncbi:hypothetical protein KY346_05885 [Candidatus Woesearchaeota archaeon]|nr:hypothetical protein [Candidatus Woesearchaeota archaeon]
MYKKEVAGAVNTSHDLEFKVNDVLGPNCKTFDFLGELESVHYIRGQHPLGRHESGMPNAFFVAHFQESISDLMNKCKGYIKEKLDSGNEANEIYLREFAVIGPDDKFLEMLNEKQFDGICEDAENDFRKAQYQVIKACYAADREAVANFFYKIYLQKNNQQLERKVKTIARAKKRSKLVYLWGAAVSLACLGTLALEIINTYGFSQAQEEFQGQANAIERRIDTKLAPKNIIQKAENYFATKEGQQYASKKYKQIMEWAKKNKVLEGELKDFYQKEIEPDLKKLQSPETQRKTASDIVDEIRRKLPGLEKLIKTLNDPQLERALNKLKEILGN